MKRILFILIAFLVPVSSSLALDDEEEIQCLALNIYHEARGEPIEGMVAVTLAVLNRVADPEYPDSVCGVISHRMTSDPKQCQFSWYCDGRSDQPKEEEPWMIAQAIARDIFHDGVPEIVADAQFYVRCEIRRDWLKRMELVEQIGSHCFYRNPLSTAVASEKKSMEENVFFLVSEEQPRSPDDIKLVSLDSVEYRNPVVEDASSTRSHVTDRDLSVSSRIGMSFTLSEESFILNSRLVRTDLAFNQRRK